MLEKDLYNKNRIFNLKFKFKYGKLLLILNHSLFNYQYFFITTGLVIKGFNYKKSLKKLYSTKLLIIKMLRKMLVLMQIKNVNLIVKGVPTNLPQYIRTLLTPINHYIFNPVSEAVYDEINKDPFKFNVHSMFFLRSLHVGNMKLRKKGRVKRKILRKLTLKNKLVD